MVIKLTKDGHYKHSQEVKMNQIAIYVTLDIDPTTRKGMGPVGPRPRKPKPTNPTLPLPGYHPI